MLIHLSREEIIKIIEERFAFTHQLHGTADIGFIDGDLVGVLAIKEDLPDLFDIDETDPEPVTESTRNTFEAKGQPVKPAKRKRRTRAEIEADEAKAKAKDPEPTPVTDPVTDPKDTDTPPFETDPVAPAADEVAAVEEKADEPNPFVTDPEPEVVAEAKPVEAEEDNPFADAGATSDPFADGNTPASDNNFFSVNEPDSSEFNKPAEDNTDVFKLFD